MLKVNTKVEGSSLLERVFLECGVNHMRGYVGNACKLQSTMQVICSKEILSSLVIHCIPLNMSVWTICHQAFDWKV